MCTCRSTLHSYASREQSSSQRPVSIYTNIRYLSPLEQKQRMDSLQQTNKSLQLKITRLKEKLSTVIAEQGVTLDEDISNDLCQVMAEVEQQPQNPLQVSNINHYNITNSSSTFTWRILNGIPAVFHYLMRYHRHHFVIIVFQIMHNISRLKFPANKPGTR